MSGLKRPTDCASSSSGGPPEKRREREGEDGGPGISTAAVETVIKLGGVSNSVRVSGLLLVFFFFLILYLSLASVVSL